MRKLFLAAVATLCFCSTAAHAQSNQPGLTYEPQAVPKVQTEVLLFCRGKDLMRTDGHKVSEFSANSSCISGSTPKFFCKGKSLFDINGDQIIIVQTGRPLAFGSNSSCIRTIRLLSNQANDVTLP